MPLRGNHAVRTRSSGTAALEFAIVLPVFLAVVIGIVYFGIVLALQQTLTLAAEEGARAALRYPSGASANNAAATQALRVSAASTTALAVLPASISSVISTANIAQTVSCANPSGSVCVRVTLNLPSSAILPAIPGVPIPTTLTGSATVQLAPDT
ncbi:TadE/TadG family type IV pilus assembly protein [Cupriavidus basilensis]|uniref:TadE/TadG family type IV pilus assembly protein n=1 Tax=Cupriavidus basilensis TaxID=68895 RepID=UPI0020A692AA|nr:TadE family protein [Cupriavidus basilensis]MCP3021617.1 pilus assembly protein [Cupriavidus basilensis]MDR3382464.1 pilus assembly protein [Cupriavidus basilensis]